MNFGDVENLAKMCQCLADELRGVVGDEISRA
jgi:hypothetical protein